MLEKNWNGMEWNELLFSQIKKIVKQVGVSGFTNCQTL